MKAALQWIGGIILILAGIGSFSLSILAGIFFLLAGVLLIPPAFENINKKRAERNQPGISSGIRYIAVVVLWITGSVFATTSGRQQTSDTKLSPTESGANTNEGSGANATTQQAVAEPELAPAVSAQDTERAEVIAKLKARAKRDWPNDYTTQEYWINESIEAYEWMKEIPDNSIKKQAQRDWPLDFVTQKYWYSEQIEAKERLEK